MNAMRRMVRSVLTRLGISDYYELEQRISKLERSLRRSDAIIDVLLYDTEFLPSESAGMNAQTGRKKIVADLFAAFKFDRVIETGTFFGMTAGYLWSTFGVPVVSCEATKRHYHVSQRLLRNIPGVQLVLDDSRSFLRECSADAVCVGERTFFYLDAHWYEDLPLLDELAIIAASWHECIIMVDDFRVPGDPGYLYDDYGQGMSLELSYLIPALDEHSLDAYFPTLPSSEETGKRRGCVVLARPELRPILDAVGSIARFEHHRVATRHVR